MDEQGHEDVEAQGRVGMVRCVRDEAFGEFMQRYGDGCLQSDREEGVGRDVVVMLGLDVALLHLVAGIAIIDALFVCQGQGVARCHPTGANGCVMDIPIRVIRGSMERVMGVEMSSGCAQRRLARNADGAAAEMLEALLATRVGVSVTGSRLVTVAFCVLDKGHDPLLDLEYGRASAGRQGIAAGSRPAASRHQRAAGPLYHFVSRRSMAG